VENLPANHALLGNIEYPLVRSKLRAWLALEEIYTGIIEATEIGNRDEFVSSLYSYVSVAFSIPIEKLQLCPWYEITRAFKEMYQINIPSLDFPMIRKRMQKETNEKVGWEYPGRTWYIWLHLFAGKYSWNVNYIEHLDIDDAIALLQEILVDDQQNKEWQWGMFEGAYKYNEQTRTSTFIPLERPEWMKPIPKPAKKVMVRKSELPVGLILKWDTDDHKYTRPQ
jgi:hypothetical protein